MDALTIVTGGAGFIGSHLVERLVGLGHRVRVVERPGAEVGHLPAGVEVVRADVRDRRASPPTRLIRDFCLGRLPARMDCTLNLIDVRDVAEGLVRVMERGRPGRRYLLGGENLTLAGLLGILSELTGVPVPCWRVPY